MKPKFSILTSSYNNRKYLGDYAASVVAQDYRPLEVVFVNDGSTDGTEDELVSIAYKFEAAGIEFKLVNNAQRLYYGSGCKVAWQNATGDYYGFLDTDDRLALGSVSYVAKLYETHPGVSYIYTRYDSYNEDFTQYKGVGLSRAPDKGRSILDMGLRNVHTFSHWRTFAKRFPRPAKLFKDGLRCAVDKYLAYRLEEFGTGMFTDRVCYHYRRGVPTQISKTEKSIKTWHQIMEEAVKRRKTYSLKPFPVLVYKGE